MDHTLPGEPEKLRRELSRYAIAALAINGLIGAGIFGLPSEAARLTGAFSPLMFVVCGLLMSTVMLSFSQAAGYFQSTGGPILYTKTAFGSIVGFETGWLLYIGRTSAVAANINLMTVYIANYWEGADQGISRLALLFSVCVLFTIVNVVGIKQGIGAVFVMTALKLAPLLLFIVVGLSHFKLETFKAMSAPSYANFGEATLLLFYAFIGFEGSLIPAGEARSPKLDIPRALLWSAGFTVALYVMIQTVCFSTLPDLASSKRPLADAAYVMAGAVGAMAIAATAVVSIAGNVAATMVTAPRMTYTLAREGGLPQWFGAVHERYSTPHWSIIFFGLLVFVLAASSTFSWLAGMSSLTRILGYGVCVAALPRLRKKFGDVKTAIVLPGGYLIPGLALVVCCWLFTQVKLDALIVTLGFILAGGLLYAATNLRRREHRRHREK